MSKKKQEDKPIREFVEFRIGAILTEFMHTIPTDLDAFVRPRRGVKASDWLMKVEKRLHEMYDEVSGLKTMTAKEYFGHE